MLVESRNIVTISRGSLALALGQRILGTVAFDVFVCGMSKPIDPERAGIVTVGTSVFLFQNEFERLLCASN